MCKMEAIKGFENYQIDRDGNVWSEFTNKFLKLQHNGMGYLFVNLQKGNKQKQCKIHRILALQFIPNPNNLEMVDHIDRNTFNNSLENLRWVTRSQNCRNTERKGYSLCKKTGKFKVQYSLNNKTYWVGFRDTEQEAREAYLDATKDLW